MKKIIYLLLVLLLSPSFKAQQFSNWNNYSDMKDSRDLSIAENGLWVATTGGAYFYDFLSGEYLQFNKSQGLNGTSLTSVTVDSYNKTWFGSSTGMIDVYSKSSDSFTSIPDIFNSDRTSKQINQLKTYGDTIFIASDFGVSLIDSKSFIFIDTYFKFGSFPSNTKVNSVFKSDLLYACTDAGIAIQKPNAVNLTAPESWDVYSSTNGLPSSKSYEVIIFNDTLYAATDNGIALFNNGSWQTIFAPLNNRSILDLAVDSDRLLILTANSLYEYSNGSLKQLYSSSALKKVSADPTETYIASNKGVIKLSNDEKIYPNGPAANLFPSMVVDGDGILWSASGKDGAGVGIYKFENNDWFTFNVQNYPILESNDYYRISTGRQNQIFAGNWGRGFLIIKDDVMTKFNANNTSMSGIPQDTNFLVITGVVEDSRNNIWALNFWPANKNSLSQLTPDSTWYLFSNPAEQNRVLRGQDHLVIDQNDTKWYSTDDPSLSGLLYFNENKTPDNPDDDRYGYLNTTRGLNSNSISSLVVDKRGDLWVGTNLGVNIITNLNTANSSSPQLRISSVFSVRQQTINAIAVDPLNQKWVGTNQGLFLLSTDGSQLLASLDSRNSPLLTDRIESIAIDETNGRVYVGSSIGLTSFDTPALKPKESFEGLFSYPNPFIIKDGSQLVVIDGLIKDTDIKILSISGKLVKEFSSPGGRVAYWDGKDDAGNLVGTGVYIIVAYDKDGSNVATGKIAVLRH